MVGGVVVVDKVSWDHEVWCGGGFATQALDRDRGIMEDPSVEWGRAAVHEAVNVSSGACRSPSATRA